MVSLEIPWQLTLAIDSNDLAFTVCIKKKKCNHDLPVQEDDLDHIFKTKPGACLWGVKFNRGGKQDISVPIPGKTWFQGYDDKT